LIFQLYTSEKEDARQAPGIVLSILIPTVQGETGRCLRQPVIVVFTNHF
jgi:hypothetical protein